ncbi:MAG: molecular chaperone DnaJ [Promethearchaeota archaeon]
MSEKEKRDYYEVLGVGKDANDADLKRAFRKKAKQYHPDLHPDDPDATEKFKEVQEAYAVLSDPDKRRRYDQFGHAGLEGGGFEGAGFSFSDIFGSFGDIFGDIFGGGRSRRRGRRARRRQVGQDVEVTVNLSFEEAVSGVEKQVNIRRAVPCSECGGVGGTDIKTCPNCGGTGEERQVQRSAFGQFVNITTCHVCQGTGEKIGNLCPKCKGKKYEIEEKKTKVNIPAGVDNGMHMKIPGHGHLPSKDAIPGDAYIKIVVRPHEIFHREDNDILSDLHIDLVTAIVGGEVPCPTIDGQVKLKIPAGTQSHTDFRLKGKGIPFLKSKKRGDQYVRVIVDIPKHITGEQRGLLDRFQEIELQKRGFGKGVKSKSKKGKGKT